LFTKNKENKMNGLRLACIYSWNCEKACLLGVSNLLEKYAKGNTTKEEKVKKIIARLETDPFYRQIAEDNKIEDPLDFSVVSSYWKGSPNLSGDIRHNDTTLIPLLKLPFEYIEADIIDDCMVHCGIVKEVEKDTMIVAYRPVVKKRNALMLGILTLKEIKKPINRASLEEDDLISFHFSVCAEKLTKEEFDRLYKITMISLNKFNEMHT